MDRAGDGEWGQRRGETAFSFHFFFIIMAESTAVIGFTCQPDGAGVSG